jgi:vacuolar-type H+-ATPase subunit H
MGEKVVKEDIIEILKNKEKEMESLVERAKERCAELKKDAIRRAEEIKGHKAGELKEEIAQLRESQLEPLEKEVERIKKEAEEGLTELRKKAEERKAEALNFVSGFVLGGLLNKKGTTKA